MDGWACAAGLLGACLAASVLLLASVLAEGAARLIARIFRG